MIGTTSTEAKAAKAREAGADEVILYSQKDFVEEVNRITDGKGVNVIYDGIGKTTVHKGTLYVIVLNLSRIKEINYKCIAPYIVQVASSACNLIQARNCLLSYQAVEDKMSDVVTLYRAVIRWLNAIPCKF